jgi:hypothetical protein
VQWSEELLRSKGLYLHVEGSFANYMKLIMRMAYTMVYPKVSGLAAWSKNYKLYSSLPLAAVV